MDMNKKKMRSNNRLAHLPQEIMLYNILTRVPAKRLHQFRCVSKQWSSLFDVDDPLFKSLHSHHSSGSYEERGFIRCEEDYFVGKDENETTTYSFSLFDIDKKVCKQIPFRLPEGDFGDSIRREGTTVNIEDSLDGVLLLRFKVGTNDRCEYCVYNPASGRWVQLVHKCINESISPCLAYDPIASKYKVVGRIAKIGRFYIRTVDEEDARYSSGICADYDYTRIIGKPVSVNYALHWICRKQNTTSNSEESEDYGYVLRFDASKEKSSIIKLPVEGSSASLRLLELGGLLWFIHSVHPGYNSQLKLWYLKEKKCNNGYRNDGEWVVKCSINLTTDIDAVDKLISRSGLHFWNREPVVIVMDPKCKLIFTFIDEKDNDDRYICSYDMELKHWDLIHSGPLPCYSDKGRLLHEQGFHYWHDNKNALSKQPPKITKNQMQVRENTEPVAGANQLAAATTMHGFRWNLIQQQQRSNNNQSDTLKFDKPSVRVHESVYFPEVAMSAATKQGFISSAGSNRTQDQSTNAGPQHFGGPIRFGFPSSGTTRFRVPTSAFAHRVDRVVTHGYGPTDMLKGHINAPCNVVPPSQTRQQNSAEALVHHPSRNQLNSYFNPHYGGPYTRQSTIQFSNHINIPPTFDFAAAPPPPKIRRFMRLNESNDVPPQSFRFHQVFPEIPVTRNRKTPNKSWNRFANVASTDFGSQ